jgi:hypothetical protein
MCADVPAVCVHTCVCVCVGPRSTSGVFPLFSTLLPETKSFIDSGAQQFGYWLPNKLSGTHLYLPPPNPSVGATDKYYSTQLLGVCWGSELVSSCLCGRHCSEGAMCPALQRTFPCDPSSIAFSCFPEIPSSEYLSLGVESGAHLPVVCSNTVQQATDLASQSRCLDHDKRVLRTVHLLPTPTCIRRCRHQGSQGSAGQTFVVSHYTEMRAPDPRINQYPQRKGGRATLSLLSTLTTSTTGNDAIDRQREISLYKVKKSHAHAGTLLLTHSRHACTHTHTHTHTHAHTHTHTRTLWLGGILTSLAWLWGQR